MALRTSSRSWQTVSAPLLITILVLAETNHAFEQNMVQIALPHIYSDFGDPFIVGWSITGYALVAAATAATAGRLGDVLGRKQVLVASLLLGTVGSFIVVISPTLPGLIIGRAVQGVTGAILGLAFGIARERLGEKRIGMALSLLAGTALIGGPMGTFVAGTLVDSLGWHSMFYFSGALALISAAITAWLLPSSERRGTLRDVDFLGGTMFAVAVTLVLLGFTLMRRPGLSSIVLLSFVGGITVAAVWIVYTLRHKTPTIDLRTFRDGRVAVAHLAMFVVAVGVLASFLVFSVVLQSPAGVGIGMGLSAAATAAVMGIASLVGGAILSPLSGTLAQRFGAGVPMTVGSVIICIASASLYFGGQVPTLLVAGCSATILGVAFLYAAIPILLMSGVPEARTSEAGNLNQVMKSVGLAIGPLVFSAVLASQTVQLGGKPFTAPTAYASAFLIAGVAGMTLFVLSLAALYFERSAKNYRKAQPDRENLRNDRDRIDAEIPQQAGYHS